MLARGVFEELGGYSRLREVVVALEGAVSVLRICDPRTK